MIKVIGLERAIADGCTAAGIRSIEEWHIARAAEFSTERGNPIRRNRHRKIAKALRDLAARLDEVEARA